jgi:hypothetical protein
MAAGAHLPLGILGPRIAYDAVIHLTHNNRKELAVVDLIRCCRGVWHLKEPVATFRAYPALSVVLDARNTYGIAVVVVPHTHAEHGLGVDHVVLVVTAAACLRLAHRTWLVGAGARI